MSEREGERERERERERAGTYAGAFYSSSEPFRRPPSAVRRPTADPAPDSARSFPRSSRPGPARPGPARPVVRVVLRCAAAAGSRGRRPEIEIRARRVFPRFQGRGGARRVCLRAAGGRTEAARKPAPLRPDGPAARGPGGPRGA